tara:strand:+ start:762 stop:1019 length:258 start_codon:yes stop_codon:yes gene_type:complete
MAKYTNVGKGAAFLREKTSEKQPDFGGSFTLFPESSQEKKFSVSLWKSRTKKGDPYLSMSISEREEEEGESKQEKVDTSGPWDDE